MLLATLNNAEDTDKVSAEKGANLKRSFSLRERRPYHKNGKTLCLIY